MNERMKRELKKQKKQIMNEMGWRLYVSLI